MKRWPLLLSLAVASSLGVAHAQNLIQNGDFEEPPHAPSSDMTSWMVGTATPGGTPHIHSAPEGATSGGYSAAFSIGGDSQGTELSQTFATTAGNFYKLTFDSGIFGQRSGAPLQMHVQVIDMASNTAVVDQIITPPEAGTFTAANVTFANYQYTFMAGGGSMTLKFTDVGTGNQSADTLVDNVSVVQTTSPGPNQASNGDFETGPFSTVGTVTG